RIGPAVEALNGIARPRAATLLDPRPQRGADEEGAIRADHPLRVVRAAAVAVAGERQPFRETVAEAGVERIGREAARHDEGLVPVALVAAGEGGALEPQRHAGPPDELPARAGTVGGLEVAGAQRGVEPDAAAGGLVVLDRQRVGAEVAGIAVV